jgi:hypothetical protein
MVEDISKLIKLIFYLSTPLASSSLLRNLIIYKGSLTYSGRAYLRLLKLYFFDSSNVTSLVSMIFVLGDPDLEYI